MKIQRVEREHRFSLWFPCSIFFCGIIGFFFFPLDVAEAQSRNARWYQQGEAYRLGQGKKRNLSHAVQSYRKACQHRHARSCWRLGQLAQQQKETVQAIRWYKRACQYRLGDGCLALIEQKALNEQISDRHKAAQYRKACRYQSGLACYYVMQLEQKKFGALNNLSPRQKYRWNRRIQKRKQTFSKFMRRGCKVGYEADCFYLGYCHFQSILPRNLSLARQYFDRACILRHANSCDFLALIYGNGIGVTQDYQKARQLHQRACHLGLIDGCLHAGGMYLRGLGGMKDLFRARTTFAQACEANNARGCLLLGEMVIRGEGGSRDVKQAFQLYRKACVLQEKEGCQRYKAMKRILFPSRPR